VWQHDFLPTTEMIRKRYPTWCLPSASNGVICGQFRGDLLQRIALCVCLWRHGGLRLRTDGHVWRDPAVRL
jgi:hypothetical protein